METAGKSPKGPVYTAIEGSGQVSIIRYRTGEVRLIWRVLIAVVLYVAVAFLLRFIPIFLYTAIKAGSEVDRQEVVESAKTIVFEHPVWSTALGILNALMSFGIVWFLMKIIEKRSLGFKDLGLDWRRRSFLWLAFGVLLALLIYVGGRIVPQAFASSMPTVKTILTGMTVSAVIRNFALYIPMGFSEEVLFRGYVQSRLVERHGVVRGILIGSIVFTLLHLLGSPLSPVNILSGVILWTAIGALYHLSKSLYLVGMFHAIANILLNTLPFEGSEVGGLIVNTLVLLTVIVAGLRRSKSCGVPLNPT